MPQLSNTIFDGRYDSMLWPAMRGRPRAYALVGIWIAHLVLACMCGLVTGWLVVLVLLLPFNPHASEVPWSIGAIGVVVGSIVACYGLRGAWRTSRLYVLLANCTDDDFDTAWELFESRRKQRGEGTEPQPLTGDELNRGAPGGGGGG